MDWDEKQQARFDELRQRELTRSLTPAEQSELDTLIARLTQVADEALSPAVARLQVEQAELQERLQRRQRESDLLYGRDGAASILAKQTALPPRRLAHSPTHTLAGILSFDNNYSKKAGLIMWSADWTFSHLTKLHKQQPRLVDAALQQMLKTNPDLAWSLVVSAYLDEEINLGKAAEMLDMHELELRDRFIELGIPLRIGPANVAEAQAEIQALNTWFPRENSDSAP